MKDTFVRWLADGTSWIGVFENKALDSADAGRRVALVFDLKDYDKAKVGMDRCPDHPSIGTGWKYLLVAKCKTVEHALAEMIDNFEEREKALESFRA